MEKIQHSQLDISGLSIHVAQVGSGEKGSVLFIHGFPQIWYSWRHQMLAVAEAGFRAIAPDLRGYGLSGQPAEPEKAVWEDLAADMIGVLDALDIPKVFVVGTDFGAGTAYHLALIHPDRLLGIATIGVPYLPQPIDPEGESFAKGFYIARWREPGRAEADFGRLPARTVVRNVYTLFSSSEIPVAGDDKEIMDLVDASTPLPPWLTEADLDAYGELYEKSGFQYALHMPYRAIHKWPTRQDARFELPALLVIGEKDYVFSFPGMADYIRSDLLKHFVPNIKLEFIAEGTHFVQEQLPEEVNGNLVAFLKDHN